MGSTTMANRTYKILGLNVYKGLAVEVNLEYEFQTSNYFWWIVRKARTSKQTMLESFPIAISMMVIYSFLR